MTGQAWGRCQAPWQPTANRKLHGEAAIIRVLAPLAQGFPGAFGLQDDCALITPAPGTELVLKIDPVAEGVHFLPDDAPEDIAWKALAVNVSDLAAKAARPLAYLMALSFPAAPSAGWLCALRRRPRRGARPLRLPPDRRRHGPSARAAHHHHHRHRRGGARPHGAARHGASRRRACSSPARWAMRRSGWRCAKSRRLAAAWGLSPRRGRASAPALCPARAAPGAGRRAARLRLRRHGHLRRPGQGPRPPVRGERLRPRRCALPTYRSQPPRPRRSPPIPLSPSASSPAATTTRFWPRSPRREAPAFQAAAAAAGSPATRIGAMIRRRRRRLRGSRRSTAHPRPHRLGSFLICASRQCRPPAANGRQRPAR